MRVWCALVLLVAVCSAVHPLEETFTIFIDLDDFHLTQSGNHEFLYHSAIGEHDNVILHLSEDEVRHHMGMHDTHDCEAPQHLDEVVSFIQEKMYEPRNFIDDAITNNYVQDNTWDKVKQIYGAAPAPQYNTMLPFGYGATANAWVPPQVKAPAPKVAPAQASAPVSETAPAPLVQAVQNAQPVPAVAKPTQQEEEDAVARFRDAYHAYKYMNKALQGLNDGQPNAAPVGGLAPAPAAKQGGLFDNLIDDNDRRMFDALFGSPRSSFSHPSIFAQHNPYATELDKSISSIVDEAFKNAMAPSSAAAGADIDGLQAVEEEDQPRHHHHHHHHHRREEEAEPQAVEEPQPAPQQQVQPVQQQAATPAQSPLGEEHHSLTNEDKKALKNLAANIAANKGDVQLVLKDALVAEGMTEKDAATAASAAVKGMENPNVETPKPNTDDVAAKVESPKPKTVEVAAEAEAPKPKTDEVAAKVESPKPKNDEVAATETAKVAPATRPVAPAMTSHIEKAPSASDFIPESVYAQQNVPFTTSTQPLKHVAKRILIPRMEEPGPVIGGGSRPLHIQLPMPDMDLHSNTRPSAPSQVQMQVSASITSAAETAAANTKDASTKPSTLAAANDEALSAPEVVIF